AKHDAGLTLTELLDVVQRHLHTAGIFAVPLPHHRIQYFQSEALEHGLHIFRKALVRQTPNHDLFRGMLFFKNEKVEPVVTEMSIKRTDGNYSAEFIGLLKDYYLHL
ncbi:MAG TPA: hypothetical protein VKH37_06645, partial [Ferruginibacter sp.]|nr:hypothetical protein [Ferruginibacter sp.]